MDERRFSNLCAAQLESPAHTFSSHSYQDKSEPKDWYKAEDLTIFPPESELQVTSRVWGMDIWAGA